MMWLISKWKIHGWVRPIHGWGEGEKKIKDKEYKKSRMKMNVFSSDKQNSKQTYTALLRCWICCAWLVDRSMDGDQEPPSFYFIPFSIALNQTTGFLLPRIVLTTSTVVQVMCVPSTRVSWVGGASYSITARGVIYHGEGETLSRWMTEAWFSYQLNDKVHCFPRWRRNLQSYWGKDLRYRCSIGKERS